MSKIFYFFNLFNFFAKNLKLTF